MNYQTTINGYLFQMMSDGSVEISYASDKTHEPIQRFIPGEIKDQVHFEKECAWWYMGNQSSLSW